MLPGDGAMPSIDFGQIPGAASRMDAGAFRAALTANPAINVPLRYTLVLLNQVAPNAAQLLVQHRRGAAGSVCAA